MKKLLAINLPEVSFVKAYRGEVPVAQKTLSKLEQRIENAQGTIFIKDASKRYKKLLLIDDAVGSGASLNETAKKLKGFDIISEI